MWDHRTLPTELSWTILVFIPKINTDTQGVVLLKILWKIVEAVINTWVKMAVQSMMSYMDFAPAGEWGWP